jgi:GntR family transcriptional regulator
MLKETGVLGGVPWRQPGVVLTGEQQLAGQLRGRITSGQIRPRDALPSIAYLTGETGLAVGTVRRAIALLVEEGYAYTVPGRGTFAAQRDG